MNVIMIILEIHVIKNYVSMIVEKMANVILTLKNANAMKLILEKNVKNENA